MFGTRKLGRTSDQRKAMLRAMTTYLFENGKIETTFTRAKEVQPVAEKMITLGKKNTLASYRRAMAYITKEDVANKLFKEIAPKYADAPFLPDVPCIGEIFYPMKFISQFIIN